jgi:hypothetical protein
MSYDFVVFARRRALPTLRALKAAMHTEGNVIDFDDQQELASIELFFPVTYDGREAGFEMYITAITDEERRDYRDLPPDADSLERLYGSALLANDLRFMFACQDATSIAAGRAFAIALARETKGFFRDPQTDEMQTFDVG